MHLYSSLVLVIRRSTKKALGIKRKGNILASCFLKTPWEAQPSPGLALHPEMAFAPTGCGKLCWVELLRFLLFVQGP